jgi:hypothetical protein
LKADTHRTVGVHEVIPIVASVEEGLRVAKGAAAG